MKEDKRHGKVKVTQQVNCRLVLATADTTKDRREAHGFHRANPSKAYVWWLWSPKANTSRLETNFVIKMVTSGTSKTEEDTVSRHVSFVRYQDLCLLEVSEFCIF